MGNIFRHDSPLMRFMMLVTNLVCLNVLWLICCLPVITAGAATTALYYVIFQYITKQDDAVLRPFLKAFKENFKKVTPVWILHLLIGAAMGAEVFYLAGEPQLWLKVVFGVLLFIYAGAGAYLYPLMAHYDNTVRRTLLNCFLLAVRHLFSTVCMVALNLVPMALIIFAPELFWKSILLWTLGGFSVISYLNGLIIMPIFKKYEALQPQEQTA